MAPTAARLTPSCLWAQRKCFDPHTLPMFDSTLLPLARQVVDSHDAENPVSEGLGFPLLVCDVCEYHSVGPRV